MISAGAAKGNGSYGPIQESKIKFISCTEIAILVFVMKPISVAYKIHRIFCRSSFQLYLWKFLCPEWHRWVINVYFVYKIKFGSPWVEAFLSWNFFVHWWGFWVTPLFLRNMFTWQFNLRVLQSLPMAKVFPLWWLVWCQLLCLFFDLVFCKNIEERVLLGLQSSDNSSLWVTCDVVTG